MAKITLPPQILSISGRFGDVVFKKVNGRTIVAKLPRRSRIRPTQAQTAVRERFKKASSYATSALADPEQRRIYESASRDRYPSARAAAIADFFRGPVIDAIELHGYRGRRGDPIVVLARDDTHVASVFVTLRLPHGTVLDEGYATRTDGWWIYRPRTEAPCHQAITIETTAADIPGNRTTKSEEWR